jgi:hypothetical protein
VGLGFPCEYRFAPEFSPHEALVSGVDKPFPAFCTAEPKPGSDSFLVGWQPDGVLLRAKSIAGFSYSIWELLERFGFLWPTPGIEQAPSASAWTFAEGIEHHVPVLEHRICFLEQVEISQELVLWLSRLRINTLFPSNPARFAEPEIQFPESSLETARTLGLQLIAGGDCLPWLLAPLGLEESSGWEDLGPKQMAAVTESTLALWREMEPPAPRLSVWPKRGGERNVGRFLTSLMKAQPGLLVETASEVELPVEFAEQALFQVRTIPPSTRGRLGYLFSNPLAWDAPMGSVISPFLWAHECNRIDAAVRAGLQGASLSLVSVESDSFLNRAGFSLAAASRMMWSGGQGLREYVTQLIHAQFEGGAQAVLSLMEDLEDWFAPTQPLGALSEPLPLAHSAHDLLPDEARRDLFDQRISAIEECPPCETCMDLVRSLSSLAGLFDFEESADIHETRALARTIWNLSGIERWPSWLQASSPLAERLQRLLRSPLETQTAEIEPQ